MNERTNEVNDLQWNHVKIENSSWQPTQQWFYFSYFAFWLKIENGERNAEHTTNGWKLKLVHTRRSTLYFQPVWQINFLLSFTVSFRLLNIMHGIVSERPSKRTSMLCVCFVVDMLFAISLPILTNIVHKLFNKTYQMP